MLNGDVRTHHVCFCLGNGLPLVHGLQSCETLLVFGYLKAGPEKLDALRKVVHCSGKQAYSTSHRH